MKTLIAIFISLHFLTASATVFTNEPASSSIHMLDMKEKNVFVFKAGKHWKGANVEVLAENGDMVMFQKLSKKKMSIDFRHVRKGSYTIKISRGNKSEQFKYQRQ